KTGPVALFGYRLSHHMRSDAPSTQLRVVERFFKLFPNAVTLGIRITAGIEPGCVATEKIGFLLMYIPEPRNISAPGRVPPIGSKVCGAFILCGNTGTIIMK